jgi:hypothetical protein
MLREEWLIQAVNAVRPWFDDIKMPVPAKVRVTCGWPSTGALASNKRRIGEAWTRSASGDGHNEIFISPYLSDAVMVVAVLIHELIHAADNNEHGHRGPFVKAARALGLAGKVTATVPSEELTKRIQDEVLKKVGQYPHATLDMSFRPVKKQSTRMRPLKCPECGYTVRTTKKWIDHGLPTCACGSEMQEAA